MFEIIDFAEIDDGKISSFILIDVRTAEEHASENIPGSINIPIFNHAQRAEIGTEYVKGNVMKAKALGLKYAGAHAEEMYLKLHKLVDDYDKLILYCARGGFRSTAPVNLYRSLGLPIYKLDGGYKKYRQYINSELERLISSLEFIVLYGNTGCGKTEILKKLKNIGAPVIDLEDLANHKGSLLGTIGEEPQPSQKMFDSLLYNELKSYGSKLFFIEGESRRIGKLFLPKGLMDKLNGGTKVRITSSMENRIKRIHDEYVHDNDTELSNTLDKLNKYISNEKIEEFKKSIENHNYDFVIEELIKNYYDIKYASKDKEFEYEVCSDDENAHETLLNIYYNLNNSL